MAMTPRWRPISSDESDVIQSILSTAPLPSASGLIASVDGARVANQVAWILDVETPQTAPVAALPDGPYPARAFTQLGEVIVWITDGRVSGLEYAWTSDQPPSRWPRPDEMRIVPWPDVQSVVAALTGRRVESVLIEYTVCMGLSGGYFVVVESPFTFEHHGGSVLLSPDTDSDEALHPVRALIGQDIVGATLASTGALNIQFGDGTRIHVEPDDTYEAWNISASDHTLLVCMAGGTLVHWSGD